MRARAPFRLCVALAVVGVAARALGYPLMAPRPVPDAIAGPTDPHVAATFYNPAAMGYLRGIHVFVDGGARGYLGSMANLRAYVRHVDSFMNPGRPPLRTLIFGCQPRTGSSFL